jgi:tRNA pseudouridine55 synthase
MHATERIGGARATAGRSRREPVDGVLLLDKPTGPTSNDALQQVRRLLNAAKAGHGGTLDPLASGLLPIAFGEATKFLHDLLDADKSYDAAIRLGVATDSGDADGTVVARAPVTADDEAIRGACAGFVGPIAQVPPMHSALKRDGRPLYDYARAGVVLQLEPRAVHVRELAVAAIERTPGDEPLVRISVRVSKGTYIRALARDIGERLGCGAHLAALRRTGVGPLDIARAYRLEQLESMTPAQRLEALAPVDSLLAGLPRVDLDATLAARFLHGQRLVLDTPLPDAARVRVYGADRLLGVAEPVRPGLLAPLRLVAQPRAPLQD